MAAFHGHFWDMKMASSSAIANIAHKGDDYAEEDVVRHTWGEIPRVYFPSQATHHQAICTRCRRRNTSRKGSPGKWNNLMMQAVKRLAAVHPTRRVYLILAVGMKWMPFLWEPATPLQNSLVIRDHDEEGPWEVDHRMHKIPNASLPGQSHILPGHNGQSAINTEAAYSLDYWTMGQGGNRRNQADLDLLVTLFATILEAQFQDTNPSF